MLRPEKKQRPRGPLLQLRVPKPLAPLLLLLLCGGVLGALEQALQALLDLYARDDHWLVRTSILAAMAAEDDMPMEPLQQLAEQGCADDNETVREAGQGLKLRLQQRRLEKLLS